MADMPTPIQPAFDAGDFRLCPDCGRLVRLKAIRCRFCGTDLGDGIPLPALLARASAKLREADALEAKGRYPHRKARLYGAIVRIQTLLLILAATGCLSAIIAPRFFTSVQRDEGWVIFGVILAIPLIPLAIVFFVQDLLTPGWHACRDPRKALAAFAFSLRCRRWRYAHSLLLPGERTIFSHPRYAVPSMHIPAAFASFYRAKGLKEYWAPFTGSSRNISRSVRWRILDVTRIDEHNALGVVQITSRSTIDSSDNLFALFLLLLVLSCVFAPLAGVAFLVLIGGMIYTYLRNRRHDDLRFTKWLYRVDDKWYTVSGSLNTGEDLLPKLYFGHIDRLRHGELPPVEVLRTAAGLDETPADAIENGLTDE